MTYGVNMRKFTIIAISTLFLALSFSVQANNDDIGQNYHYEEVKDEERTIASQPIEAVEPAEEHEDDNDRSVASDEETEPSHKGVKFWKFKE